MSRRATGGRADVAVVGSGNAALSAAISAAEAGASVVVLEKAAAGEAGGNTWYTAGAFRVAHEGLSELGELLADGSDARLARTDLPPYPREDFLADMLRLTDGRCDPERTAVLVEESLDGIRWLDGHGVPFELMYHRQAYELDGSFRFWGGLGLGVVGGGKGLVAAQLEAARRRGVEIVFGVDVSALARDPDGAVAGVLAADGRRWEAGAVVLCCGGFQADPAMRAEYLGPAWGRAKVRGTPHNTGDGHRMALDVGAAPAGDWSSCHSVAWDVDAPGDGGDRELTNRFTKQSYPLGIVVNRVGARFLDEGADFRNYTYARLGSAIIEQPGSVAFQLFDAKTIPLLRSDEYEVPGIRRYRADGIAVLAEKAGIDAPGLERTVSAFNAAVGEASFDPARKDGKATHGIEPPKSNWALPLDRPPFLAVEVTCGITFTFGGLSADVDGRVLDPVGEPIPGLFAAGEIVGGLFAGNYPGGSGLTAGTVFGRRGGRAAAKCARGRRAAGDGPAIKRPTRRNDMNDDNRDALAGVTVADFTQVMMGPCATQMLADHGADVIKVERAGAGDLSRSTLPSDPDGPDNPVFASLNRNKRSIALDLRDERDLSVAHELVRRSDVVVSNFRPGVMERLGLGWEEVRTLNPRAVYAVGTGYGTEGPYARKGGQDMLAQAMSGIIERRADPTRPPEIFATTLADYSAGMHLFQGILLALRARERTGRGQRVEVSLYDAMLAMQMQEATHQLMRDAALNWAAMPHTGAFETRDGAIVIVGAFREDPAGDICRALGAEHLAGDPRFASFDALVENAVAFRAELAAVIARETTATCIERLEAADLLCAPIRTLEQALEDPQTEVNGMVWPVSRDDGSVVRTVGSPVHLSASPARVRMAPPRLGEHTEEVAAWLGVAPSALADDEVPA